jgi:hypothetical protein
MNSNKQFDNYDIILIAQNRDNKIYNCKLDDLEGYHPELIQLEIPENANTHKHDSYYKCFGFIYDKTSIEFNLEDTQNKLKINFEKPDLQFVKLDLLEGKNVYPIAQPNLEVKRNLFIISRFAYTLEVQKNTMISKYILQYCAFSSFKNKKTNLEFVLYNTHFIGTLKDSSNNWIKQYQNIINFIKVNKEQDKTIIIGDFNIRSNFKTYEIAERGIKDLINSLDIGENKFSNQINLYKCTEKCENTLLIRKNDIYLEVPDACVDLLIGYNCHKPVTFTILSKARTPAQVPQPAPALAPAQVPPAQVSQPSPAPQPAPAPAPALAQVPAKIIFANLKLKSGIDKKLVTKIKQMTLSDIKNGRFDEQYFTSLIESLYDIKLQNTNIGLIRFKSNKIYNDYEKTLFVKLKNDINTYKS